MSVMEQFNLRGRTAVVTGGAGLFGRQIVEALAEAGAKTITASRDVAKLALQAESFRSRGLDVTALPLDQANETSVRELLKRAGEVDILVNNAVLRPMKGWDDPIENFETSLRVNATGLLLMTRTF